MKFISVLVIALLLAGAGAAQNYLPEFTMEPGADLSMFEGDPGNMEMWSGNINNATYINGSFFNSNTAPFCEEIITVYADGTDFVAKTAYGEELYRNANATYVIQSISDAYSASVGTKVIVEPSVTLTGPIDWKPQSGELVFKQFVYSSTGVVNLTGYGQKFYAYVIDMSSMTTANTAITVTGALATIDGVNIFGNSSVYMGKGIEINGYKTVVNTKFLYWWDTAVEVDNHAVLLNIRTIDGINVGINMSYGGYGLIRFGEINNAVEDGILFSTDDGRVAGENRFLFGIISGCYNGIHFENMSDGYYGESNPTAEGNVFIGTIMGSTHYGFWTEENATSRYTTYIGGIDCAGSGGIDICDNAGYNYIYSPFTTTDDTSIIPDTTTYCNGRKESMHWDIASNVDPVGLCIPIDGELNAEHETRAGSTKFNTATNTLSIYNGAAWKSVALT